MNGITVRENGNIIIEGAEAVNLFHMLRVRRGLMLEIKTGMKVSNRGSIAQAANAITGNTGRSKQKALDALNKHLMDLGLHPDQQNVVN